MSRDYMSEAARAFLEQPAPDDLGPLGPDTVGAYRKMAKDEFLPRSERAVAGYGVTVAEVEIGGVPCLDILPPGGEPIGTVLYCYGGGYVTGSAREDLIVSAGLCRHSGARVVAVDYRLAPEHPYPAAIEDGAAVYDVLCREAGAFGIAGESAGGNMALALMQRASAEGLFMPVAAVLLSPWCDLAHGGDSVQANDGRDPTLDLAFVEAAAKMYAGETPRAAPGVSPIGGAFGPEFPPTLVTTGTRDLLMSPSIEVTRRMRAAGVSVDLVVYDGLWHVFEFYDELPEAAESLSRCGAHLARHMSGG
jgi:acetyl esterase/lipase